jgi:hypothetical protein
VDPAWITAAIALGTALLGIFAFCARWSWRLLMRIVRLLDDYFGEPAREGVPARPGVMLRLRSVEDSLAHIVTEVNPNGGKSLRDIVNRTASDVVEVKREQVQVRADLAALQQRESS